MTRDSKSNDIDLTFLLVRFSENASEIKRLTAKSDDFRELCEHYSLARAALKRFEGCLTGRRAAEVEDYRKLVPELEQEIRHFIANADCRRHQTETNINNQTKAKEKLK